MTELHHRLGSLASELHDLVDDEDEPPPRRHS
jgi:hypothetical protein